MPRIIDFGEPFGTREFPDNATDDEIIAEYNRVSPPPTASDYLRQATRGVITGAAKEIASIPKAVGTVAGELRRAVGYIPGLDFPTREGEEFSTRPEASEAYKLGELIERAGEAVAPAEVPQLRGSFLATQVPQAVGSGLGFLAGGATTRLLRRGVTGAAALAAERRLAQEAAEKGASLGTKALAAVSEGAEIGTLGAVSQFQNEYEKAINAGADRDTALRAGLYGLPIGATEAVPLSNMLRRLDRFSEGGFSRYLLTAGKEAFEEALQEAAQNFASNAVEKGLYNEAKSLTDDLIPQAGAGGAAGFLLSTLTQALGGAAARLRKGQTNATENRAQIETPSGQAPELVGQTETGVRLRNLAPQVPLETQQGTAVAEEGQAALPFRPVVPPPPEVPRSVQQGTRVQDVLERISQQTSNPFAELAGALRATADPAGLAVRVQLNPSQARSFYRGRNPQTERIEMSEAGASDTQSLIHESIHAFTSGKVPPELRNRSYGTGYGASYLTRVQEAIASPQVSEPVREVLQLYLSTADALGYTQKLFEGSLAPEERGTAYGFQVVHPIRYGEQAKPNDFRFSADDAQEAKKIISVLKSVGIAEASPSWIRDPGRGYTKDVDIPAEVYERLKSEGRIDNAGRMPYSYSAKLPAAAGNPDLTVKRGVPYGFGDVHEFLAEAFTNRKFQEQLASIRTTPSGPSLWQRFVTIVRKLLGLSVESETALDRVIRAGAETFAQPRTFEISGERPLGSEATPLAPPIQGVQVAGAAAQLGRVAEEAYAKREAATTQLSGLAYERQQYKAARNELRRLTQMATGRLFQEGLSIEDNPEFFPNPDEGVGIQDGEVVVGDQFLNKLSAGGENPNPENTKAMQGEAYFEKEAHRLSNLRSQIDLLQRAKTYYTQLKVDAAEIEKIDKTLSKLSSEATKLSEAQWNGKTIGERTNEIEAAEAAAPGLKAQRQALGLGPVSEFFGRQVGGFRSFIEKAQQGLRIAAALRDKATTPEELNAAVEEASGWLFLPEEVKAAILSGKGLTDEQRGAAYARLGEAFEDFDIQRQMMGALRDSGKLETEKKVKELTEKIAAGKIEEGLAQVQEAALKAALKGEFAGTGTLQEQATAQKLADDTSAIKTFALNLGNNVETNGALFQWLTNPSTPVPVISHQMATALGVSENTLQMILSEVKKNPVFGSAVVTLINSANKKLENLPIVQIQQIQQAIESGDAKAAQAAANAMIRSAKARASLAATSQRNNLRELEKIDIERQALDEGVAMFNEVAASPEFRQLRDAVNNSPYGLVEPMDVANNTARTLRPFGSKETPSHPGVKLDASDSIALKSEDFNRVAGWRKAAQEHLDAYDAAQALYLADPQNNPSPSSLGFDLPVIRGLRDAITRSTPGLQELSTQDQDSRWKVPWLVRVMNRLSWFRQHDFVAKMVGGTSGLDLRQKLGDWINHFLIARSVSQRFRDIPALRHAAMKSHPEVQMNQSLYRDFWNELAHEGRTFGSSLLRPGSVLPKSGRVVTAEDLALLKRETEYEEALRRQVTETRPVTGVRVKKGRRELVRPGAYVGQFGLPRHLNVKAGSFIADVTNAYGDGKGFNISSDLSQTSTDPVVAFWNQNPQMLVQHVLDSTRQDRTMRLDPLMAQAERTAAADWTTNVVPPIQSLEDLVNELVKHFPSAPGLNVREQVVKGLNDELMQYRNEAARIESERAEKDQARNSKVEISFTADNEFTKPAANLALPTELYDYGALTDTDHLLIQNRANHERVVAYATALQRAIADLHNRLVRYRDAGGKITEKEAFNGQTVDEAKDVLGLLTKLREDFETAYKMGSPALTQGGWFKEASGLLTSAVLALPTVNLRNMTQGQFEVYTMAQAMGLGGQRMLFARSLLNMPRTLARYALHIGSGLAKRTDLGAAFLTGHNYGMFTKLVDAIAKMMFQGDYRASADRIHELGFDTREGFLERMRRLWQASAETTQPEDIAGRRIKGKKVGKLAGIPIQALRALFDTIGVQESDLTINAAMENYGTMLEKRLQEVAMNYGAERERQGLKNFDPTDPRWKLQPDEWASGNQQAAKDSLALFTLFMEQSASAEGFQLEKNLWDYYQKSKAGPARLFTPQQFDATQRGLLAQFNASTPANRASAAAGNNVIRNLLTLQGYTSDGLLKLLNAAIGGTRDRKLIAAALAKLPIIGALALMSVLIGYMVGAITGEWEKRLRGRAPSLPTPMDKDFWTSFKRWGEGTARLSMAQLFYLGDLYLWMKGEISGNRGFDPVGRVFPISVAQRTLGALRGMWSSAPQASLSQRFQPGLDWVRSMVPWYTELERVFGTTMGIQRQGKRVIMGEAQNQDLLPERRSQPLTGPQYGPTTIIRRDLEDAVSRFWEKQKAGDAAGAAQALETAKGELKKLQDYYAAKYAKAGATPEAAAYKAQGDVWRDYQELNPAVAGMLGKRPTAAEWNAIRGAITGDRAKVVDDAIAAWQSGAQALFGRSAPVTKEEVAAGRAGTGGGFRGGGGSVVPRGGVLGGRRLRPAGLGLMRPVSVSRGSAAPRLRVGRGAALPRTRRAGTLRLRRPRLRRAGPRLAVVRRISAGRRAVGALPRRRNLRAAGRV